MNIDRKLNLVLPVERETGAIYVHSTPISKAVFETYFEVISKTFASIYGGGHAVQAGPRIAAMMLKKVATDMGIWGGQAGVENGLMNEIRRLSNVIAIGDRGWETMPLDDAIARDVLGEDDLSEVENAIVFFIVASSMHKKTDLPAVLGGMGVLWDALTTSSNSTEYANSLKTSTRDEPTGETAKPSSIPS